MHTRYHRRWKMHSNQTYIRSDKQTGGAHFRLSFFACQRIELIPLTLFNGAISFSRLEWIRLERDA